MYRSGFMALAIAAMLVLAGCVGFSDDLNPADARTGVDVPAAAETTTGTETTAHETTPTTAEGPSLAPGLSEDGVTDALELATAHARALRQTSYTVHRTNAERYGNGTLRLRSVRDGQFGADRSDYYFSYRFAG